MSCSSEYRIGGSLVEPATVGREGGRAGEAEIVTWQSGPSSADHNVARHQLPCVRVTGLQDGEEESGNPAEFVYTF